MKNIISTILITLFSILSIGCVGDHARIGTGEVGKIISSSGANGGIIKTSAFRMPYCGMFEACPYLVRLQTTKSMETIAIKQVFITKSKVDLDNVEVAVQFRIRPDEASINKVFNEIRPGEDRIITSDEVWATYLQRKVPDAVVGVLRNYSVDDILGKIPEISAACHKKLSEETKDIPVEIAELSFPNGIGDIPEQVILSYRKLYAVEADKQRSIKELEAELEVEKQRLAVQRVRANNDRAIAGELGVPVQAYMGLKIDEKYSDAVADAADNNQPFALGSFPMGGK